MQCVMTGFRMAQGGGLRHALHYDTQYWYFEAGLDFNKLATARMLEGAAELNSGQQDDNRIRIGKEDSH